MEKISPLLSRVACLNSFNYLLAVSKPLDFWKIIHGHLTLDVTQREKEREV